MTEPDRRTCDEKYGPIRGLRNMSKVSLTFLVVILVAVIGLPAMYSNKLSDKAQIDSRQDAEIKEIRRQYAELLSLVKENRESSQDILKVVNHIRGRISGNDHTNWDGP